MDELAKEGEALSVFGRYSGDILFIDGACAFNFIELQLLDIFIVVLIMTRPGDLLVVILMLLVVEARRRRIEGLKYGRVIGCSTDSACALATIDRLHGRHLSFPIGHTSSTDTNHELWLLGDIFQLLSKPVSGRLED